MHIFTSKTSLRFGITCKAQPTQSSFTGCCFPESVASVLSNGLIFDVLKALCRVVGPVPRPTRLVEDTSGGADCSRHELETPKLHHSVDRTTILGRLSQGKSHSGDTRPPIDYRGYRYAKVVGAEKIHIPSPFCVFQAFFSFCFAFVRLWSSDVFSLTSLCRLAIQPLEKSFLTSPSSKKKKTQRLYYCLDYMHLERPNHPSLRKTNNNYYYLLTSPLIRPFVHLLLYDDR